MAYKGNPEQIRAITSDSRTILVLAAAGSGKTYCLINRIDRLVKSGTDPSSILALTFTNAAAAEMAARFKKVNSSRVQPEFRTFHGFAYSVIVKEPAVREKLGYSKIPDICEDSEWKRIKTEMRMRLNIKIPEDKLYGSGLGLTLKEKYEFDTYWKAINKKMKSDNLITFDMLNSQVAELFASHDASVERFRKRYKHILADEFQDTDDIQMKFLNSFDSDVNFFFVGDSLQNIYQFRNTTNKYIKLLANNPDWEVIKLFNNYRSTNQICEFANSMSTYADESYRIEMKGQRDGDDVEVIYGGCADYVDVVDAKHVKKVVSCIKESTEDSAILCRTNKEVQYMCECLKSADIEFTTSNKTNYDKEILRASTDNSYMMQWLSSMLETPRYVDYIRASAQMDEVDPAWFISRYGSSPKIHKFVTAIVNIRAVLSSGMEVSEQYQKIRKVLSSKLPDNPENLCDTTSMIEFLNELVTTVEEHRIYVGTIHSSKGLEYGHVYVMGVGDRSFPIDSEEMKNLYYVAITRAKNHLTVFKG